MSDAEKRPLLVFVNEVAGGRKLLQAARARVEVTMAILREFGIDSIGEVMDPDPFLALDDAVRAHEPGEVLLSALSGTRYGLTRKDFIEWAREKVEPDTKLTHIA